MHSSILHVIYTEQAGCTHMHSSIVLCHLCRASRIQSHALFNTAMSSIQSKQDALACTLQYCYVIYSEPAGYNLIHSSILLCHLYRASRMHSHALFNTAMSSTESQQDTLSCTLQYCYVIYTEQAGCTHMHYSILLCHLYRASRMHPHALFKLLVNSRLELFSEHRGDGTDGILFEEQIARRLGTGANEENVRNYC